MPSTNTKRVSPLTVMRFPAGRRCPLVDDREPELGRPAAHKRKKR